MSESFAPPPPGESREVIGPGHTFGSVTGSLGGRNDHVQLVLLGVGLIFH